VKEDLAKLKRRKIEEPENKRDADEADKLFGDFDSDEEMGEEQEEEEEKQEDKDMVMLITGKSESRKNDKSTAHSQDHITETIVRMGMSRDSIMNLSVNDPEDDAPWDLSIPAKYEKAKKMLEEKKPALVIGCPTIQITERLNESEIKTRSETHMEQSAKLYKMQTDTGGYILVEHPEKAASWKKDHLKKMIENTGSITYRGVTDRKRQDTKILTRIKWITNAKLIGESLTRKKWRMDTDKGSDKKQTYPLKLGRTIARSLTVQLLEDRFVGGINWIEENKCAGDIDWIEKNGEDKIYWDDITGEQLERKLADTARGEEMTEVRKHKLYKKVPISKCYEVTGKAPVKTKWIDINKGDRARPEYRSRLVAMEIATGKRDDLFAATPPLEAIKVLLSLAVTEGVGFHPGNRKGGMKLDFIDVRRAYFHAKARRSVFVELPKEDEEPGMCGELLQSMYGTRDAAQNWEREYHEMAESLGFTRGTASPCTFHHPDRDLRMVVHGDDFTILGWKGDLDWLRAQISKRWEVKYRGRLGPDDEDDKQTRLLNRVIEWTPAGIKYEPDQRHAEIIVKMMKLDQSNAVGSPGVKDAKFDPHEEEELLDAKGQSRFRAMAARANYLAQDRSDIQFSVKEISRHQANPSVQGMAKLKRLGRYLTRASRWITSFNYQRNAGVLTAWVDTDFAGCKKTRRSTSGGIVTLGGHVIKTWSATQAVVALSSGEAEYYGIVKGGSQGLGARSLLADLNHTVKIKIKTDAAAAKGIATRRGLGKVRHIDTRELWLQEKVGNGDLDVEKIKGTDNWADALTKYLDQGKLQEHVRLVGGETRGDRHDIAPEVDPGAVDQEEKEEPQEKVKDHPVEGQRQEACRKAQITTRNTRWADVHDDDDDEEE
jgi:hypothetical protein